MANYVGYPEGLVPGSAQYYRRRFESSVMGNHMMMPPKIVVDQMVHPEAPPTHPTGPNTSFQFPTPMPYRFDGESVPAHNRRHELAKPEHPIYTTTTSEVGKLPLQATDLHMRWYGLEGMFTKSWGDVLPKTLVNSGLNTSMDRSVVHPTHDQGWSGHLGLTHYNIANGEYAKHVVKGPRRMAPGGA
jgi:hypothetical protein